MLKGAGAGLDKEKLKRHKKNKTELASLIRSVEKLWEQLEEVQVVSGKVVKSGDEFPYIKEHLTVQMAEPRKAGAIKARIRMKEKRKAELEAAIGEVEDFIAGIPEGIDREIFEMVYLDGLSQQEAGEAVGYTQSMVSKIIGGYLKDS